jgi:hypothetical protein
MANQLKMALVASIITLHGHGWSQRRIARELGIHRETVGRYVGSGASEAKPATNAPTGSTVADNAPAAGASSPESGIDPSKPASNAPTGAPSAAAPFQAVILQKLEQGLTAQRIYQDLISEQGYGGSYYSVRRLIRKLAEATPGSFGVNASLLTFVKCEALTPSAPRRGHRVGPTLDS